MENLLYNFNLKLGDTIKSLFLQKYYDPLLIVNSIDSVLVYDKYRKRFNINNSAVHGGQLSLIEGVGTNIGLLGQLITWDYLSGIWDMLNSYYYKGEISYTPFSFYSNKTLFKCNTTATDAIEFNDNGYYIFPNPASDYIIVESRKMSLGEHSRISIYNNVGQLVLSQPLYSMRERIDIGCLVAGYYSIKIMDSQGNIIIRKFVKA